MFRVLLAVLLVAALPGFSAAEPDAEEEIAAEIHTMLTESVAGWNAGDIGSFMEPYWRSDALRFASGGTVSYGWQMVHDRYLKRYPDRKAMGRLEFTEMDIRLLGEGAALAFGRWTLHRDEDAPTGLFTLVLRRLPEGWRIIHDHTSSDE